MKQSQYLPISKLDTSNYYVLLWKLWQNVIHLFVLMVHSQEGKKNFKILI